MIALQGHAGTLSDCTECHGVVPTGAEPHGLVVTAVVENEILGGARTLGVSRWDGRDGSGSPVATGVYFVQWRDPQGIAASKLLVVK